MLLELSISNFVLIDEINLQFSPGLNVFTGETGAGKSMLLDALQILCGEKADRISFRDPERSLKVQAVLGSPDSALNSELKELGVELDEDEDTLIVRREISPQGKNRCFINGSLVRVQDLKRIAPFLVHIHSQHQTHALLSPQNHPQLFYRHGSKEFLQKLSEFQALYTRYQELTVQNQSKAHRLQEIAESLTRLQGEVDEISALGLSEGEEADLEARHHALVNAQEIRRLVSGLYCQTDSSEDNSLAQLLIKQGRELQQLVSLDSRAQPLLAPFEQMEESMASLRQSVALVDRVLQGDSSDTIESLETRMHELMQIRRRFAATIPEIIAREKEGAEKIFSLLKEEKELKALDSDLPPVTEKLWQLGQDLTQIKHTLANSLNASISQSLQMLAMPGSEFEVKFKPVGDEKAISNEGFETLEFYIRTNAGQPMSPLSKVASGGETSRLMLALIRAFIKNQDAGVIVFDEIDSGIGGETAHKVAEVIKGISLSRQSIVITHLPQMALQADRHFSVSKQVSDGKTRTLVQELSDDLREQELFRMYGIGKDQASQTMRQKIADQFRQQLKQGDRS